MNRMQKMAWMMVVCTLLGLLCSVVAVGYLYGRVGMPKALSGLAFMGLAGLGGFAPLIFWRGKEKVEFDERDRAIGRRASWAGFGTAYLFVGLACMVPFGVMEANAAISVRWLPMIFGGAGISHFFAGSVALLILYGRERGDG